MPIYTRVGMHLLFSGYYQEKGNDWRDVKKYIYEKGNTHIRL
jgi:hypothetical protein